MNICSFVHDPIHGGLEGGGWGLVDGAEQIIFPAISATVDDHLMDDEISDPPVTIKEEEEFDGGNVDEPPYSCDRCHFSAKRRATLVKHVKENHEDDENTAAKSKSPTFWPRQCQFGRFPFLSCFIPFFY